jgi:hypothetical protein
MPRIFAAFIVILMSQMAFAEELAYMPFPSHASVGDEIELLLHHQLAFAPKVSISEDKGTITETSSDRNQTRTTVKFKSLPAEIKITDEEQGGANGTYLVNDKSSELAELERAIHAEFGNKFEVKSDVVVPVKTIDWAGATDVIKSKLTGLKECRFLISTSAKGWLPVIILAQEQFRTFPGQSARGDDGESGDKGRNGGDGARGTDGRDRHSPDAGRGMDGRSGGYGGVGTMGKKGIRGADGKQPRPFVVSSAALVVPHLLLVFSADGQRGGKGGDGGIGGAGGDDGDGGSGGAGGDASGGKDSRIEVDRNGEEKYVSNGYRGGNGGSGGNAGPGGVGTHGSMGGTGGVGGNGGNGANASVHAPERALVVIRLGDGGNAGDGGDAGNNGRRGKSGQSGKLGKGGKAGKGGVGIEPGKDGTVGADGKVLPEQGTGGYNYKTTTAPGGRGGRAGESGKELDGSTGGSIRIVVPGKPGKHGWAGKRGGREK